LLFFPWQTFQLQHVQIKNVPNLHISLGPDDVPFMAVSLTSNYLESKTKAFYRQPTVRHANMEPNSISLSQILIYLCFHFWLKPPGDQWTRMRMRDGHPIQSESAKEKTENVSCNFDHGWGTFFEFWWFAGWWLSGFPGHPEFVFLFMS